MPDGDWRDRWDDAARAEYDALSGLPFTELADRVRRGKLGSYHTIWSAIAARNDPRAGWLLYDYVTSSAEYLQRYNCARALLSLLSCTQYEAADLTVAHRQSAKALAEVERMLAHAVGPRPAGS